MVALAKLHIRNAQSYILIEQNHKQLFLTMRALALKPFNFNVLAADIFGAF